MEFSFMSSSKVGCFYVFCFLCCLGGVFTSSLDVEELDTVGDSDWDLAVASGSTLTWT